MKITSENIAALYGGLRGEGAKHPQDLPLRLNNLLPELKRITKMPLFVFYTQGDLAAFCFINLPNKDGRCVTDPTNILDGSEAKLYSEKPATLCLSVYQYVTTCLYEDNLESGLFDSLQLELERQGFNYVPTKIMLKKLPEELWYSEFVASFYDLYFGEL